MGIREKINQNPKQTAVVTSAIVALSLLFIIWQACGDSIGGGVSTNKAFYTTDDGKTWFVDDSSNIPPYKKDGKDAVRAQIFTCDDGKTKFCGYLEAYAPQDKMMLEQMAKAQASGGKGAPAQYVGYTGQAMVKKPGAPPTQWVPLTPQSTAMYQQVTNVQCPAGGNPQNLARVFPD